MKKLYVLLILSVFFSVLPVFNVTAASRTALVIGNGSYMSAPLKNPVNDASDIANVLIDQGFKVVLKINATQREMKTAVKDFGKKLRQADGIGLFYYAGHGLQINGRNYLIPVDADITSESDVQYESLDAGRVLGKMEDAGNDLNIIILDACRNNPFARSFRSMNSGLARMDAPKGSIIAYATSPGELASDGGGRNGIYTKYLIRNIQNPQLTIEQVFKNVRVAVVAETSKKQVPWESSSLMGAFYFDPQKKEQKNQSIIKTQPVISKKSIPVDNQYDLLFWESIKSSKNKKMFEAYLKRFPTGTFVELAKINIELYTPRPVLQKKLPITTDKTKSAAVQYNTKPSANPNPVVVRNKERFIRYKNGIIADRKTGLEWFVDQKHTNPSHASAWAKGLSINGRNWRLPTTSEILKLCTINRYKRLIPPIFRLNGHLLLAKRTGGMYRIGVNLLNGSKVRDYVAEDNDTYDKTWLLLAVRQKAN